MNKKSDKIHFHEEFEALDSLKSMEYPKGVLEGERICQWPNLKNVQDKDVCSYE